MWEPVVNIAWRLVREGGEDCPISEGILHFVADHTPPRIYPAFFQRCLAGTRCCPTWGAAGCVPLASFPGLSHLFGMFTFGSFSEGWGQARRMENWIGEPSICSEVVSDVWACTALCSFCSSHLVFKASRHDWDMVYL